MRCDVTRTVLAVDSDRPDGPSAGNHKMYHLGQASGSVGYCQVGFFTLITAAISSAISAML